jgi:hypothetical protein
MDNSYRKAENGKKIVNYSKAVTIKETVDYSKALVTSKKSVKYMTQLQKEKKTTPQKPRN